MALFERDGVALQARDLDILVGLFECRVMTLSHITELYFDEKSEAAKKRIQRLKAAGFVLERPRRIGDPSVLYIGKKAFRALKESGRLARFPDIGVAAFEKRAKVSDLTLCHELEVQDVRTAFFRAVKERPHLSITEFFTWPALYQFKAFHSSTTFGRRELTVKPDGFIRIREKTNEGTFEHMFFLEVDRSTEALSVVAQKGACYLNYYQSGGMAVRFGKSREDYKSFPFRVLMVCKTEPRKENVGGRLFENNPPILTQMWLSTLMKVTRNPLGSCWNLPRDYGRRKDADFHALCAEERALLSDPLCDN